jgi:predicted dehydrogenase
LSTAGRRRRLENVIDGREVVRLGIVGVGDVAQRDYLPEIHRLAEVAEVVAVAGAREKRVRETAKRMGIPDWTVGYEPLLAMPEVDAVLNLTPFGLHAAVNEAAMTAGKHVYSEKPLASTAGEARKLRHLATEHGVVLVAAPSVLLFPQVRWVSAIVSSGRLGRAVSARGTAYGGVPPWEGYASDPTPFFSEEVGPLVDMAVYPLHAITGLLGPVAWVTAASCRSRAGFEVVDGPVAGTWVPVSSDDEWHLLLGLASGLLATVQASFATVAGIGPELEILGDRGGVACTLLDVAAPVRVSDGSDWSEEIVPHERDSGPDHILGVRHLVECILGETDPVLSPDHAVHVLDVLEGARQSAEEGRRVNLS